MEDFALICTWDGEALRPQRGQLQIARDMWRQGDRVVVSGAQERSAATHKHYFATINDYFASIPEDLMDRPWARSPETLRKHALISTGYCESRVVDCGSKAAAERIAAFARDDGDYCVVLVRGSTVVKYRAHSQKMRSMGRARFQASKEAVLGWLEIQFAPKEVAA